MFNIFKFIDHKIKKSNVSIDKIYVFLIFLQFFISHFNYKMDFEESFVKCISEGNTQGIKALGVDNECINDIVFFYFPK